MSFVNLSEPLRTALISSSGITSLLESYKGSYPIFTRRPVPDDAPDISIVISQDVTGVDEDGVNYYRSVITRDIMIYGTNETSSNYRTVQRLARKVHDLFHHNRTAISVSGYKVVLITATGPLSIPQDDQSIAQGVTVTIVLARRADPAPLAVTALDGELDGLSLNFLDDFYYSTTGLYGSMFVKNNSDPYSGLVTQGAPFELLTNSNPSRKLTRGPDGSIRYNAHNLLEASEKIGIESEWNTTGITATDNQVAPDGEKTAQLLVKTTTGSSHRTYNWTSSSLQSYPAYGFLRAKYAGHRYVGVEIPQGSGQTILDVLNGEYVSGTLVPEITDLGDGWFEYKFSGTFGASPGYYIILRGSGDTNGGESDAGDGVSGIYVWRAQLTLSPADLSYVKTGNAAASYELPYEWDEDGNSLGIKLEEQQTNLCLYSSDLTKSNWTKNDISTSKTATGPGGTSNSATILTATDNYGSAYQDITASSAQRITSVYLKRRTGTGAVYLTQGKIVGSELITNGGFDSSSNWNVSGSGFSITGGVMRASNAAVGLNSLSQTGLNLQAGKAYSVSYTISNSSGGQISWDVRGPGNVHGFDSPRESANGTHTEIFICQVNCDEFRMYPRITAATMDIDNITIKEVNLSELTVTDEWARYETSAETFANPRIIIGLETSGDKIDVALVQHEEGPFASSPIETLGSTVTRADDNVTLGTDEFPWNNTEGTVFAEAQSIALKSADSQVLDINDGTSNNRHFFSYNQYFVRVGGGSNMLITNGSLDTNNHKFAWGYEANNWAMARDGTVQTSSSLSSTPTVTTVMLSRNTGHGRDQYIKRLMILPERKTNTELQELTSA